jgi:hypothetical protein
MNGNQPETFEEVWCEAAAELRSTGVRLRPHWGRTVQVDAAWRGPAPHIELVLDAEGTVELTDYKTDPWVIESKDLGHEVRNIASARNTTALHVVIRPGDTDGVVAAVRKLIKMYGPTGAQDDAS